MHIISYKEILSRGSPGRPKVLGSVRSSSVLRSCAQQHQFLFSSLSMRKWSIPGYSMFQYDIYYINN